jgi:hypothetical protein
MSRADQALEKMNEAAGEMKRLPGLWNAADPVRVENCRTAIERAAQQIEEAEEMLRSGESTELGQIRVQAMQIKADACGLRRLLDEASAFLRRAFPEIAACAPVYGCAGNIVCEAAPVQRGLQA